MPTGHDWASLERRELPAAGSSSQVWAQSSDFSPVSSAVRSEPDSVIKSEVQFSNRTSNRGSTLSTGMAVPGMSGLAMMVCRCRSGTYSSATCSEPTGGRPKACWYLGMSHPVFRMRRSSYICAMQNTVYLNSKLHKEHEVDSHSATSIPFDWHHDSNWLAGVKSTN